MVFDNLYIKKYPKEPSPLPKVVHIFGCSNPPKLSTVADIYLHVIHTDMYHQLRSLHLSSVGQFIPAHGQMNRIAFVIFRGLMPRT